MTKETTVLITLAWIGFGLIVFAVLLFVSAPYGRHVRKGWGPSIPNRLGWVLMELPSMLCFATFFLLGPGKPAPVTWLFFAVWIAHYTNRSLIFPFRTRTKGKTMPLVISLFAVIFNLVNGSLNGFYLSNFRAQYTADWLVDPRFITGAVVLALGVIINVRSDRKLLRLRNSAGNGYKIPYGGFFNYVSCPNFFGEILEWTGFAIMVWNPAGLAFALWTFFNLLPRGLDHHRWYRQNFEDYPKERKAVVPFLV
jgi:protein-S-isoprenylcysteine O-methyltransferase Ste14